MGAWSSHLQAMEAERRAQEEAALLFQSVQYQQERLMALSTDGTSCFWIDQPELAHTRDKCDGCGSREFKRHHGQSVCVYCRSTA
jgi:hypothetical protein